MKNINFKLNLKAEITVIVNVNTVLFVVNTPHPLKIFQPCQGGGFIMAYVKIFKTTIKTMIFVKKSTIWSTNKGGGIYCAIDQKSQQ